MPYDQSEYDDWLTLVRWWVPTEEEYIPGIRFETYVERHEDEAFITVIWDDGSDAGRVVRYLHGEAEWRQWREELDAVYADPRWRPDDLDAEATLQVEGFLQAEALDAVKVQAAGSGDAWEGYNVVKARAWRGGRS